MDYSMPGFHVFHYLPELAQTHVHWVGDGIQPSHPLSSHSPPAFSLSQHQGLFQWVTSLHQMAKVLELQLQHQSFQWIFRVDFLNQLINQFRIDWFDLHMLVLLMKMQLIFLVWTAAGATGQIGFNLCLGDTDRKSVSDFVRDMGYKRGTYHPEAWMKEKVIRCLESTENFKMEISDGWFRVWDGLIMKEGFPSSSADKESSCSEEDLGSISGLGKIPWRRERLPSPVF